MAQRGPYAKTAAVREQILSAALDLIAEQGLSTTTVQQIADAVGLTKAGILHHFDSREGLLVAVLARSDEQNAYRSRADGRVSDFLIELDERNLKVPGLVALHLGMAGAAAAGAADTPARHHFVRHYASAREAIADDLRAQMEAGEIRADLDAELLAVVLTAVSDGAQLQQLIDGSVPAIAAIRQVMELLRPEAQLG